MATVKTRLDPGEAVLDRLLRDGVAVAHECGGKLACSTCQVIVREGAGHLSAADEDELDMLERAEVDEPGARLACQAVSKGGEILVEVPDPAIPARAAGSLPVAACPITVSERAARHLAVQLAKQPRALAVRLSVEPSGCSGFGYRLDPTEVLREDDTVFEAAGVRLAVDALSLPYLQGSRIELVQEGLSRRLRFDNPNARQSCGCGESFGV